MFDFVIIFLPSTKTVLVENTVKLNQNLPLNIKQIRIFTCDHSVTPTWCAFCSPIDSDLSIKSSVSESVFTRQKAKLLYVTRGQSGMNAQQHRPGLDIRCFLSRFQQWVHESVTLLWSRKHYSDIVITTQPVVYLNCNMSGFVLHIQDAEVSRTESALFVPLWFSYIDSRLALILCMHAYVLCWVIYGSHYMCSVSKWSLCCASPFQLVCVHVCVWQLCGAYILGVC